MILEVKKNYEDAKLPARANKSDAGLDVYAYSMRIEGEKLEGYDHLYKSISFIEYDCGISIQPNSLIDNAREHHNYFTYLAPRSSVSKYNLLMCNGFGVIDAGYSGPLKARFKYIPDAKDYVFINPDKWPNFGIQIDESKIYGVGDKIAQLIVTEQHPVFISKVPEFAQTDRGAAGFGSSGA